MILSAEEILEIEDAKTRLVAALFSSDGPLRQADIARVTGMSPQRVDYNLRELVSRKVVVVIEDEESGKLYMLQEFFYDDTFIPGLATALSPLAEVIHSSISDKEDTNSVVPVIENINYAIQIASIVLKKSIESSE